jgi:Tol biopolymer transport system component
MLSIALFAFAFAHVEQAPPTKPMSEWPSNQAVAPYRGERHLKNIKQLTFGGENAEAYWSIDGTKICFQSTQPQYPDEQIFTMNPDGSQKTLVSTGLGRCTCSYFSPDMKWVYFSSTYERDPARQPRPDMSKGYVWLVNPNLSLFRKDLASGQVSPVIDRYGYVAEATIAPDGSYMAFTATFDRDIEIYRSDLDGTNIKRLTSEYGYDGGPFVSWDSKKIVYRRSAPFANQQEIREYTENLKRNAVRPSKMDLWVMDADGSNKRQVTHLKGASFAPFLHPDGKRIIFSSNFRDPKGREFDLYMVNLDGTHLERITTAPGFDGFPMFTRDGKKLLFGSNRYGKVPHETNIFVADWVE